MPRLSGVCLRTADSAKLAKFYVTHLGMKAYETPQGLRVGYEGQDADILLQTGGGAYRHNRTDRYWKIGITLPNVDLAYDQLRNVGLDVSEPKQFLDIGYMCHLSDPDGFQIELLQHDFHENRPADAGDTELPLGGDARIGQITLRTGNIAKAEAHFERLGMRLLSVQPVEAYEFELYFFAYTDDEPPCVDLKEVGNREWLWRRPYTTLELQCIADLQPLENPGFKGIEVEGLQNAEQDDAGDPILNR